MCEQKKGRISGMKNMTWTCSNCDRCLVSTDADITEPCYCDKFGKTIPWATWGEYQHPDMPVPCERKHQLYMAKYIDVDSIADDDVPVVTRMDASQLGERVYCSDYASLDDFFHPNCCYPTSVFMRYLFTLHGYDPKVEVKKGPTDHSCTVEITAVPPKKEEFKGISWINPELMEKLRKGVQESMTKFLSLDPEQQEKVTQNNVEEFVKELAAWKVEDESSLLVLKDEPDELICVHVDTSRADDPVVTVTKEKTITEAIDDHHTRMEKTITNDIFTKG